MIHFKDIIKCSIERKGKFLHLVRPEDVRIMMIEWAIWFKQNIDMKKIIEEVRLSNEVHHAAKYQETLKRYETATAIRIRNDRNAIYRWIVDVFDLKKEEIKNE